MTARFTTNATESGRVCPRRVRLTVDASGDLVWCELFLHDGTLKGAGPTLVGLDASLRDVAEERLSSVPPADFPMYWHAR